MNDNNLDCKRNEYRIRAVFKDNDIYGDRTYKRKIFENENDALNYLQEAKDFYANAPYAKYIDSVIVQRREVTEWK